MRRTIVHRAGQEVYQMNTDLSGEKESPDEDKDIEKVVFGERRSSVQAGELKVDAGNQAENHGAPIRLRCSSILQVPQQQQPDQGSVVCWERFLHVKSIRVLLVEDDDSTRHVVTALLRNCKYEVVDATNGLQAWTILENLNNHIDIVLTEVVMPCLSGIGLLYKIMSHKTRKNIPVIMMSSHDSVGLVFKCLSKGAVDFLVKPIRKNELKNLWQHVWRRCHSSSGSGSESATPTQKSVKSKGSNRSGNSPSDNGEYDAINGLNAGDGSDDGSGAQSSRTKQAAEVDSSQALSPMDQVAECPDSTCVQVICSNADHSDYNKVQVSVAREGHGQKLPETVEKGNDLDTIVHRNAVYKPENPGVRRANPTVRESGTTREVANKLDININSTDDCEETNFELSLKRLRGGQDTGGYVQDECYVLRRSEQSAFSRYNTSTNIFKSPNTITSSSSILDNSIAAAKRESVGDIQVFSADHIVYQYSNGVISNNIEMGSSTNKLPKDKYVAKSEINGLYPSAFRPVKNDLRYSQQQTILLPKSTQYTDLCQKSSYQYLQIHQNFRHHHHNFHKLEKQPSSNHDEPSLKQFGLDAPHCGLKNVLGGSVNGNNTRNCSLHRSDSGRNHGSNGKNGSSTAVNATGNNAESDVWKAGKSGSGDASGSGSGNKADDIRFAQREAALIKFRQKRKDRCFKKKVRYQTRKKLAEQRPRVRGQFVKQSGTDSSN